MGGIPPSICASPPSWPVLGPLLPGLERYGTLFFSHTVLLRTVWCAINFRAPCIEMTAASNHFGPPREFRFTILKNAMTSATMQPPFIVVVMHGGLTRFRCNINPDFSWHKCQRTAQRYVIARNRNFFLRRFSSSSAPCAINSPIAIARNEKGAQLILYGIYNK